MNSRITSVKKLNFRFIRNFCDHAFVKNHNGENITAKSFDDIPKISGITFFRRFLPGGEYDGINLIDMYKALNKEFGDIVKTPGMFGKSSSVCIFNAEDMETVFRNDGLHPNRRSIQTLEYYRNKIRTDIYGEYGSVFTDQGERWYKMRKNMAPVMLKPQILKQYIPDIDALTSEFVQKLKGIRDDKNELPDNADEIFRYLTLESIGLITLNCRLGLLNENANTKVGKILIEEIRRFFIKSHDFEINPSIWKFYHTKAFKDLLKIYETMTEITRTYIEDAVKKFENKQTNNENVESILENLLKIDKRVALSASIDSIIGGVDTTAVTLSTILYCLAKNPEKQKLLRDEILKILPNKDDRLTAENMKTIPYLRAVIKEGLRLYTPSSANTRLIVNDVVLAGYHIPKGQEIHMAITLPGFNENQYPKPNEFIPERWIKSNQDPSCPHSRNANPFSFIPFGAGARMCVGRRIAELELEIFIARIIRTFNVEWNYDDLRIKGFLMNFPENKLKFKMTEI